MAPTKKASSAGKAAGKAAPRAGSSPANSAKAGAKTTAKAGAKTTAKTTAKPPARTAVVAKAVPKAPVKKPTAKAVVKAPAKPAPKPAPVAKAPKPPPKRKGNAAGLSPKDLEAIKAELLANRAILEKEFEDLEVGSLHISQSELSGEVSFDEDSADAGTFTFERERDLSLSNNIRDLMDKVDTAMKRLADGSYGTCERCGRAIDKARLKALPYSVLCISCKKQEERVR